MSYKNKNIALFYSFFFYLRKAAKEQTVALRWTADALKSADTALEELLEKCHSTAVPLEIESAAQTHTRFLK